MDDSTVAFWLKPAVKESKAEDLLNDPANSEWVDLDADNQRCIKVRLCQMSKIQGRLVSFGRPQRRHDIVLPSRGFSSTEHCYFDVNPVSGAIMLHDVSKKHDTKLFRHVPGSQDERSQDELNNSLSIRTCVILPDQRYIFKIGDMEFLLIPAASSNIELEKFVDSIPQDYKTMRATTYAIDETNQDEEEPSNPQTSPRLHLTHATIKHRSDILLGCGGEAQVYRYLNLQDGNRYACKIIPLSKNAQEVPGQGQESDNGYAGAIKKRVAEEVRALSRMRHDNVILYNYTQGWDSVTELKIFMPCYDSTLRKMLPDYDKRICSDWRLLVDRMISDISSALKYIHGKGCFHRDIKPDNILVNGQSFCVTDFGMASFPTRTGPLPVKRGHTWQYAAPEILRNEHETFAVDIFSFGVMILECLAYLPLVASSGTQDVATSTLNTHDMYRHRLAQEWPAAELMMSDTAAMRPCASRIYKDLLNSGGVPMPGNARPGDSGSEPRRRKRRLAPERRLGTPGIGNDNVRNEGEMAVEPPAFIPGQVPDPDPMVWMATIPERPAPSQQQPLSLRDREARNARRQQESAVARRTRRARREERDNPAKRLRARN